MWFLMLHVSWWTCTCIWRKRSCKRIRVPQSPRDVIILKLWGSWSTHFSTYIWFSMNDTLLKIRWSCLYSDVDCSFLKNIELGGETTIVSDWDHLHCNQKTLFQPRQFMVNLASDANLHEFCWRIAILWQRDALWFSKSYKSRGLLNWPHSG